MREEWVRMSEKICGIYKITNLVNGKVYIGQNILVLLAETQLNVGDIMGVTINPPHISIMLYRNMVGTALHILF